MGDERETGSSFDAGDSDAFRHRSFQLERSPDLPWDSEPLGSSPTTHDPASGGSVAQEGKKRRRGLGEAGSS